MVPFGNRRASFCDLKTVRSFIGPNDQSNPAEVVLPPVTGSTRYYVCKLMLNGRRCPKFGSELSVAYWVAN